MTYETVKISGTMPSCLQASDSSLPQAHLHLNESTLVKTTY